MTRVPDLEPLFRAVAEAQQPALSDERAIDRVATALERKAHEHAAAPRRRWSTLAVGFLTGTLATTAVVVALWATRAPALGFVVAGAGRGTIATPWRAEAEPVALSFSDGSLLVVQPQGEAVVDRVSARGADVRLARGRLRADVRHTGRSAWRVTAGPFVVHVTGTRFSTAWQPTDGRFVVTLREGRVVVAGAMLGDGVPLRPGQELEAELATGRYVVSPIAPAGEGVAVEGAPRESDPPSSPAASEPAPPAAPIVQRRAAASAPERGWRALADAGRSADAYDAAERAGWERLCARGSADDLAALGDVARWARHPGRAKQAFAALLDRFPSHARAADAVFALGVIEAEDEAAPARAAELFRRYGEAWPDGALAAAAAGRLIEAERALGDPAGARGAAATYLRRFPHGPHAALARGVIGDAEPERPAIDAR